MKVCPQCAAEYSDDSLNFCLEDGEWLNDAEAEPATAIMHSGAVSGEAETRSFAQTTDQTALLPNETKLSGGRSASRRNSVIAGVAGILLVTALGIGSYWLYGRTGTKQIESIAVMPFVNESGNADVEYLSDGMTETLIGSLSKLANLSVKARNAVFPYKGKEISAKQIGEDLGVQAVLLGRLVERGGNIKLNLELVNAKTLDVIWSEQYDRKQGDLVALQQEIARDVSGKLKLKLSGADRQKLAKNYTNDPEAYRLYLQGRFYLNKRVGSLFERAGGYLNQAVEKDPNFALGYAALAEFIGERDRPKAREYTMRALALDDQLSEAHASLGYQYIYDFNWPGAESEFKHAIELDPNNAKAYQGNGARLLMIGKYDEAMASFDRAIEIEPTMVDIRNSRAGVLVAMGKLDDAIDSVRKSMEIDPTYAWAHSHISFIYRMKGDKENSVAERARAAEMLDQTENARKLKEAFAKGGWTAYLHEIVGQDWGNLGSSETRRASFLAELGENEEAIKYLEKGAARGDYWLFSIKYDPAFDGLRGDPRFQALLKKFEAPQ